MSNDIFPAELVIKSLRDSGYKNAAYALAELVDNSVQAGATNIDIYLCEATGTSGRKNLENIFVSDNGSGMDEAGLVKALRFGDGTRLNKEEWTGIGKFGMGLPSASISQCKNVQIWSRKKGADKINHTYLDIEEVRSGSMRSIPKPSQKTLPSFMPATSLLSKSGTIVLWNHLDKCTWKTAKALHTNSAFLLGRIYRYFLDDGKVKINFVYFDLAEKKVTQTVKLIKNDPMYLMADTLCPIPFNTKPMFQIWEGKNGDNKGVKDYEIDVEGQKAKVQLKFSIARKEARDLPGDVVAGNTAYGKDARKNQGVSLVRNHRELEMDTSVVHVTDATERWWGVEVSFDPILDDVFGVTNNKQHARNFSEMQNHRYLDLIEQHDTVEKAEQEMKNQGDPTWVLFRVCHDISTGLTQIRKELKVQTQGSRSIKKKVNNEPDKSEQILTNKTEERAEIKEGATDKDLELSAAQKVKAVEDVLTVNGHDKETAHNIAEAIISSGTRYNFEEMELSSPAFFDVRGGGSINLITINTAHPFYKLLYSQVINSTADESADLEKLKNNLDLAAFALKILIGSWARMEDEASDKLKTQLQDIRFDWGKLARDFLKIE